MSSKIDIIILQDTKWVGRKGQIISVAVTYAKNVLIPQWIGKVADQTTKNNIAHQAAKTQHQKDDHHKAIEKLISDLSETGLIISTKVTAKNTLYGKIDTKELIKIIHQRYALQLSADELDLDQKIESIGTYRVKIHTETIKWHLDVHVIAE